MSTSPLMRSISGVRGIFGESLTLPIVSAHITAFYETICEDLSKKELKIIVGRDSRISGPQVLDRTLQILVNLGAIITEIGIVPTPTVQLEVINSSSDCGIVITSSHNPKEWNGLKFVDSQGLFLGVDLCKKLYTKADHFLQNKEEQEEEEEKNEELDEEKKKQITIDKEAGKRHINSILELPYIDIESIKKKGYCVCIDTINGAGGRVLPELLRSLGVAKVVELNTQMTGVFAHSPEPIPENLNGICETVVSKSCDFGIAVDPDADRCVLIGPDGKPLGEEYTLAIAVYFMLEKVGRRGPVCKNLSSSRAIDDIAKQYSNCPVYSTRIGEMHVASKMIQENAVIGGEGNGGVMLPDLHIGRDSLVATALVIQCLASENCTLNELKKKLPQYQIEKLKVHVTGIDFEAIKNYYIQKLNKESGVTFDFADGIKIDHPDWWCHLRKSNTEPVIRVIGESSNTKETSLQMCQRFMKDIKEFNQKN
ncbi:phosphoglucosamine mutase family protein [Anaeramoeba flamelloides]|uniref:Phosphoglucosamine mutase family protein n=1 Tax=Anaeramoeba flamelloides TaxID=1746091 RepID=A0AAV7YIA1_9EUKA|nr:phosphoglucosamine mutase family protein [Anaeramoeba flamelloides]